MKKKLKNDGKQFSLFKIDLKLKLTTLLLLVAIFNSRADTYAQKTKVSLELNNTTVERVIETIEQKTDFKFIYKLNDIDLDRVVSIHVKNQNITVVLDQLFKGVPTEIIVRDTQIMLKKPTFTIPEILPFLQQTVKGKVLDENRMPMAGATVTEQNTKNSVVTGFDGSFQITVQSNSAMLVVTYMGYVTKVFLANEPNPTIQLQPETTSSKRSGVSWIWLYVQKRHYRLLCHLSLPKT